MNARSTGLDPDSIVSEALRRVGDESARVPFVNGLEALCESIASEARCTPGGLQATREALVQLATTQARMSTLGDSTRDAPDVVDARGSGPVFIIGLPRTGTTLLHNLLAQVSSLRCPMLWELMRPLSALEPAEEVLAVKDAEAYVRWYYENAAAMSKIHPMDAHRPDECQRLLSVAFFSPIYWIRYHVPRYAEWYLAQNGVAAYELHRALVSSILRRSPIGLPVLKDPFHVWQLDALSRVYPSAKYIFLHRDPAASVASLCSLTSTARGAWSAHVDCAEIGRFWMDQVERLSARMPAVRSRVLTRGSWLELDFNALTARPLDVVRDIMTFVGLPLGEQDAARVRSFIEANPLQKHGVHSYSAEHFGLTEPGMKSRLAALRAGWTITDAGRTEMQTVSPGVESRGI